MHVYIKNPTCVPETSGSFPLILTDSFPVASSIPALKLLSVAALSLRSPVRFSEHRQDGRQDENSLQINTDKDATNRALHISINKHISDCISVLY